MEREGNSKQKADTIKYIIILAVITAGVLLQITTGQFPYDLIGYPVNLMIAIALIVLASAKPGKILTAAGSLPVSVFLIVLITILTIVMGLMPDNRLKGSWPFALTYFMILINLALIVGRRVRSFRLRDTGFILNHAGLFILLLSAGLGAADSQHLFMKIYEGETSSSAEDYVTGNRVGVPFKLTLEDFGIEYYAPKFFVIDTKSGIVEQLSDDFRQGLNVTCDTLTDAGYEHEAMVRVKGPGVDTSGWVSSGVNMQPGKVLQIDRDRYLSMGEPQTKSFCSSVVLINGNDSVLKNDIRVNHPMRYGSWRIYQFSYDRQMGSHSQYSVLELVRDPWIIPAYIGIFMLLAGAVSLFWKGGRL
ncbi:MAG: cytochrome c biogenesis protein ResB [Bacteroidales bacterium]|nr:cytochrome c biogenesis protein ResB [Bacteroidales bacterium]